MPHLKHGDVSVAVDLGARGVQQLDLAQVAQHLVAVAEEVQVVLAKVQLLPEENARGGLDVCGGGG
jgi:hypothetical protein